MNVSICNLSAADTDPTKYSLYAVVCHEIDEALGSGPGLDGAKNDRATPTYIEAEDLFRYSGGVYSFSTRATAQAYFCLDKVTSLVRYNQHDGGDFGDFYSPNGHTPVQVQDAFNTPGSTPVPALELRLLDVLGYNPVPAQVWVDFSYSGGTRAGTYRQPYITMANGVASVLNNGTVKLKGPHSSAETITISKPITVKAIGGAVTIGH